MAYKDTRIESEVTVEDLAAQPIARPVYPQKIRDDCLKLSLEGYSSRNVRRILAKKWTKIPDSSTIRAWLRKDERAVRSAIAKVHTEADVLDLLKAESEYIEDVDDEILSYTVPSVMKDLEAGGVKDIPLVDRMKLVQTAINNKSQRNDRKIMREDPRMANVPQFIILASRQSPEAPDGSGDSGNTTIIDADFEQVADIPATGIQPASGSSD